MNIELWEQFKTYADRIDSKLTELTSLLQSQKSEKQSNLKKDERAKKIDDEPLDNIKSTYDQAIE